PQLRPRSPQARRTKAQIDKAHRLQERMPCRLTARLRASAKPGRRTWIGLQTALMWCPIQWASRTRTPVHVMGRSHLSPDTGVIRDTILLLNVAFSAPLALVFESGDLS